MDEDIAVELKCCELCGRIFSRPVTPKVVTDSEGRVGPGKKQVDCGPCIANPPEEDQGYRERTFSVHGVAQKYLP